MSDTDADRLIEKFGVAIHGEQPEVVMTVLVSLLVELCRRWQVSADQVVAAIHESLDSN